MLAPSAEKDYFLSSTHLVPVIPAPNANIRPRDRRRAFQLGKAAGFNHRRLQSQLRAGPARLACCSGTPHLIVENSGVILADLNSVGDFASDNHSPSL